MFGESPLASLTKLHEKGSAKSLIVALSKEVRAWQGRLPADEQLIISAHLADGSVIDVHRVRAEGYSGIVIEGTLKGKRCLVAAHHATLQLVCYIEKVEKEEDRRTIGFS